MEESFVLTHKNTEVVAMPNSAAWRVWLAEHGSLQKKVWLRIFKKDSGIPSISIDEAVDDAICFGWIDSLINKFDELSFVLYFAPRNPKSNWSRVNKTKVARLIASGQMMPHGLAMVEFAQKSGTWTALDEVEDGIVPPDLRSAFQNADPIAQQNFEAFPRSFKRGLLELLFNTKGAEARQKRIAFIVEKALKNEKRM